MKHETINSILGGLGLVIASVTAWFQFAPTADQIQVVSENRIELGNQITIKDSGAIDATGNLQPVFGPVTWKIRVNNETDRVVSIVDWNVFLITDDAGLAQFSEMDPSLASPDLGLVPIALPVNIAARETVAYFVSINVPFERSALKKTECFAKPSGIRETERCVFSSGKDIFGNTVSVKNYGSVAPDTFSVSWESHEKTPKFYLELETADGSRFPTILSYFPTF